VKQNERESLYRAMPEEEGVLGNNGPMRRAEPNEMLFPKMPDNEESLSGVNHEQNRIKIEDEKLKSDD